MVQRRLLVRPRRAVLLVGRRRIFDIGVADDLDHDEDHEHQRQQAPDAEEEWHVAGPLQAVAAMRASGRLGGYRLQAAVANISTFLRNWLIHTPWGHYNTPMGGRNIQFRGAPTAIIEWCD